MLVVQWLKVCLLNNEWSIENGCESKLVYRK